MESLEQLIEQLTQEAASIQIQGRPLRPEEMARVEAIHQSLPHLRRALEVLSAETVSLLITYKIVTDQDGKLKRSARSACNFWNRFVAPSSSIVIRLGIFTSASNTIARAYRPYRNQGVTYGVVEFNTKYLKDFTDNEIAGTIIHEIGHTLGFGWDTWKTLFDSNTGKFKKTPVAKLPALKEMRVETDFGSGTRYSHWDEASFDKELMTGFQDSNEHVLPVTIDVMTLLGHNVIEQLPQQTDLGSLLDALSQVMFSRHAEAKSIDRDHFELTEVWEHIPHNDPIEGE